MSLRARIVVPMLAAIALTAALLAIVWWQITSAQDRLRADLRNPGPRTETGSVADPLTSPDYGEITDSGDRVLLHLRQGDLLAAQGEWGGAQTEYQGAVDAGGGIPALRKLAQAELQRRDIDGAKATIELLKS